MQLSYFRELAAKASTTTNSEEAKRIKSKLIKIGAILTVIGFGGSFLCFVMFGIGASQLGGFGPNVLIPFFLLIPFGVLGSVGSVALKLGLGIVVAGATAKFVDLNKYCPKCGDVIEPGENFCSKCGEPLLIKKKCTDCGFENDIDSIYCKNCGKKL